MEKERVDHLMNEIVTKNLARQNNINDINLARVDQGVCCYLIINITSVECDRYKMEYASIEKKQNSIYSYII